jgi:hypothetical protein
MSRSQHSTKKRCTVKDPEKYTLSFRRVEARGVYLDEHFDNDHAGTAASGIGRPCGVQVPKLAGA